MLIFNANLYYIKIHFGLEYNIKKTLETIYKSDGITSKIYPIVLTFGIEDNRNIYIP